MPNHIHALLYYAGGRMNFNTIIGNGKRFMAYEIVNRLTISNQESLLKILKDAISLEEMRRGRHHQVWIESFDAKECRTKGFILQKLNYIHNNPCSGNWQLADNPIHYPHSSASYYSNGVHTSYPVVDYRTLLRRVSSH